MRGVTLIEMMVALVLGLIVAGAAMSVFLANKRTYVAAESIGRLQSNARVAFELMARDLREATANACGTDLAGAANVVNNPTSRWSTDYGHGIVGYGGAKALSDAACGTGDGKRRAAPAAVEVR